MLFYYYYSILNIFWAFNIIGSTYRYTTHERFKIEKQKQTLKD